MPHLTPDPTPAIAPTGSADVSSASSALANQLAPTSANPSSTLNIEHLTAKNTSIPHSEFRIPHFMDRLHLIAALAETKVITAFESLDALAPAEQLFHDRLASAIQGGYRATAMRKTVILLDSHFEALAQARQAQADARAASEAEQARLAARREAEAQAAAELHRQAIDRAEELVTRLAAQDPYLRQALAETRTDLAALFNRLRTPEPEPEPEPSGPNQKEIDTVAEKILDDLFNKLRNAHPETQWGFANAAWHAAELARVDRGEPDPHGYDDDFDDLDDEDDEDTPEWDDEAVARRERAASLGPRTASSATPSTHANPAPLSPFTPFTPQTAINSWLRPATPTEQQTTTNEPSPNPQSKGEGPVGLRDRNPQSTIRNCAVPACPTLSPRRLQALLDAAVPGASVPEHAAAHPNAPITAIPETDSQTEPHSKPVTVTPTSPIIPNTAPAAPSIANEQLTIDIHTVRARARPGF